MFERFEVVPNADMSQYTTLKLGGPADWLAFPRSREEIAALFDEAGANGIPVGASHLDGEVCVRPPKSGDTLRLPGGTKELRRILTDRKVPADRRGLVPVVACGETVLAVYGVGGNRDCLPREGETTYSISFREKE